MDSYQVDRIFSEKISGANTDRPQLKATLDYVREGDTLYIESISRRGRSTKDLLNIIDTLTEKGVTLINHKENIDTDTPAGKFMLTVFAALSQLKREQLKQRQREVIEIAKAQGKCETDFVCANRLRLLEQLIHFSVCTPSINENISPCKIAITLICCHSDGKTKFLRSPHSFFGGVFEH